MRRLFTCLLLVVAGCSNDLDKKQSVVREDFGRTALLFAQAAETREKGVSEFADKSFGQAQAMVKKEWDRWLDTHTDDDGNLVMTREDGTVGPMPVRLLTEALVSRSDKLMELALAQKDWKENADKYRAAIVQFRTTVEMLNAQEVDVQAAKESAQAAFNQVLGTMGGIAVGAAAIAPFAF